MYVYILRPIILDRLQSARLPVHSENKPKKIQKTLTLHSTYLDNPVTSLCSTLLRSRLHLLNRSQLKWAKSNRLLIRSALSASMCLWTSLWSPNIKGNTGFMSYGSGIWRMVSICYFSWVLFVDVSDRLLRLTIQFFFFKE